MIAPVTRGKHQATNPVGVPDDPTTLSRTLRRDMQPTRHLDKRAVPYESFRRGEHQPTRVDNATPVCRGGNHELEVVEINRASPRGPGGAWWLVLR